MNRNYGHLLLVLVLIAVVSTTSLLGVEEDYFQEYKKQVKTREDSLKFFQGLSAEQLLKFGHQVGGWVQDNPDKIGDAGCDVLMSVVIEKYIERSNGMLKSETLSRIINSREEPSSWRLIWIQWLSERSPRSRQPNVFFYFEREFEQILRLLYSTASDAAENTFLRIAAMAQLQFIVIQTLGKEKESAISDGNKKVATQYLRKYVDFLAKRFIDTKDENLQCQLLANMGFIVKNNQDASINKGIEKVVRDAFSARKGYSPLVQVKMAQWIVEILKDPSIESELADLGKEYPSQRENVEWIQKQLRSIKPQNEESH